MYTASQAKSAREVSWSIKLISVQLEVLDFRMVTIVNPLLFGWSIDYSHWTNTVIITRAEHSSRDECSIPPIPYVSRRFPRANMIRHNDHA